MAKWYPCDNCGKVQSVDTAICARCREPYEPRVPHKPLPWATLSAALVIGILFAIGLWWATVQVPNERKCRNRCSHFLEVRGLERSSKLCAEACSEDVDAFR